MEKKQKEEVVKKDVVRVIDNLELHEDKMFISVNPKIYSLDVIYSAAYVLMDRAYFVIDGDPEEEILVEVRPKTPQENLETLGRNFNNELLNYAVYRSQSEKNREIKESIVRRALYTTTGQEPEEELEEDVETEEEAEEEEEDLGEESYLDDPLGIATPWEEKYGKEKEKERKKDE